MLGALVALIVLRVAALNSQKQLLTIVTYFVELFINSIRRVAINVKTREIGTFAQGFIAVTSGETSDDLSESEVEIEQT